MSPKRPQVGAGTELAAPRWRKVLYLKQPYEDNYVDETFLDSLVLNANVQRYKYRDLCRGATGVIQRLCLVAAFVSVWLRAQRQTWSCMGLAVLDLVLLLVGYAFSVFMSSQGTDGEGFYLLHRVGDIWKALRILAPLWVLAPVLRTLTRSWSDDTIVALVTLLLVVHILVFDYSGTTAAAALPGGALALNSAMLAATMLASRLETCEEVFAFLTFAMEVFAFFPHVANEFRNWWSDGHAFGLTALLAAGTGLLLVPWWGTSFVVIFFLLLAALGFGSPVLLIWAQAYKAEIQGPWDIVHITPSTSKCREAPCGG